MVKTLSTMIPLGTKAPDFRLRDARTQEYVALQDIKSPVATVIMFICNHCPFVKHIQTELVKLTNHYQKQNIRFVGISSNDAIAFPADSEEKMREEAEQHHYNFPYLYDETQEVAKSYQATCTPDFFVFDKDLACVYRGRFDETTPGNQKTVTGNDLRAALDALLAGKFVNADQHASMGCNIKWK